MKKPTLKDVAKEAGVSVGMASRVLGNYGYFSEETKEKVLKAAKKVNYRRNLLARALKNNQTKAIGVIISNIASFFWATIVRAIEDSANKSGYHIIVCNTDEEPEKAKEYISMLYERSIDGLIISPSPRIYGYLKKISEDGLPVVLVDRKLKGLRVPTITVDNENGAYEAVKYLVKLGHSRIAIITGLKGIFTSDERLSGYNRALIENNIQIDQALIKEGKFKKDMAYQITKELVSMKNPPTAIFTCNETMTLGAILALKEMKIDISKDVKVVGFGNPDWIELINPPITTVSQPTYAIGTLACENLLQEIKGVRHDKIFYNDIVLKTELIIREEIDN